MKMLPSNLLNGNGQVQIIRAGKFIQLQWVKESRVYLYIYTCRSSNTEKMGQSISTEDGQTIKTVLGILQENTG